MAHAQQDRGKPLVVGSEEDYPPFAIGKTDETASGFTVDLWKVVAAGSGLNYAIRVRPFRQILEEFKAGKIDVMINLAQSEERRAFADFSIPHVIVNGAVFVRKGESRIRSEADLAGKSIIVVHSDLVHDYAVSKGWTQQLVLVNTAADGLKLLASGQHDAMLVSKLAGMQTLLGLKIRSIKALDAKVGFSQKFCFAVQEGNSELLAKINDALASAKSSGTYDLLYEKWFGVFEPPEVTFRQLFKYIGPILIAFLIFAGFLLTRQHERKKVEDRLRDNEERLRLAMAAASQGLYDLNVQTGECIVSPEYALMLGYDPADFRETNAAWRERLHPDDREAVYTAYSDYVEGRRDQYRIEFRQRTKDGEWKWILSLGSLVARLADGRPLRMLGTHTDITERKLAETDRRKVEAQLQHTQKLESLGVLAGGIAHDFSNLLTGILGYSDLALLELPAGSPARPLISEAVNGARRAAELSKQMLAYSGKGRFVVEPLNLSTLVEDITRLLQISISKKCVMEYDLMKDLPAVEADAAQVQQIIMNLLINASEAIGDRSGVIALGTGVMHCDRAFLAETCLDENLTEGLYVYLEVADSGIGMSKETQSKIFDPFFTTKFTGRGLGLSAVLGIVRGHRGAIHCCSELGKGTTFKVLFPPTALTAKSLPCREAGRTEWHGRGTVLVVDDEESVRGLARQMLEKMGFAIQTAANGREAVEVFRSEGETIRLVLLDMTMPYLDGEQTFREMRRLRRGVRAILSSGYDEQTATCRFAGEGLAGFIQKPYHFEELKAVVRKALGSEGPDKV